MLAYIANKYVALQWINTANVMIKKKSFSELQVQFHQYLSSPAVKRLQRKIIDCWAPVLSLLRLNILLSLESLTRSPNTP